MTSPAWRKSSWTSDGTQGDCVEVAELPSDWSGVQGLVGGTGREACEADGQALARR
jgi:hypothetical protein